MSTIFIIDLFAIVKLYTFSHVMDLLDWFAHAVSLIKHINVLILTKLREDAFVLYYRNRTMAYKLSSIKEYQQSQY